MNDLPSGSGAAIGGIWLRRILVASDEGTFFRCGSDKRSTRCLNDLPSGSGVAIGGIGLCRILVAPDEVTFFRRGGDRLSARCSNDSPREGSGSGAATGGIGLCRLLVASDGSSGAIVEALRQFEKRGLISSRA